MTAVALPRNNPPDPRLLQRCLLLAVLLHIWLVLVFGNAAGTAAPGQGVWGSLTVRLLGRSGGDPGAPLGDASREQPDNGAPGTQSRSGGQPRAAEPEPEPEAEVGAAELGRWNPREVPPEAARSDEVSPAPPSTATLTLPEGFRPIEKAELSRPPTAAPLQTPTAEVPTATIGRLETRPEAPLAPLPAPASLRTPNRPADLTALPTDLPAAVNRLESTPAPATPSLPRPSDLRPPPTPATATPVPAAELPPPVNRLEAPAETVAPAPLPRPADLRATPAANTSPALPSAALPPAVQRLEMPAAEGARATALPRASELRTPAPDAAAPSPLPSTQDLPTAVRRLESADNAAGVSTLQPATSPRLDRPAPGSSTLPDLSTALPGQVSAPAATAAPAGPAKGDPNANPYATPRASPGSPEAGSRLGPDAAMPPSAAASTPRAPLNLSLPRGDIASRRGPGLIDIIPTPPERKSKLEQSIEDAANKDCRKAYAGAGLLAVVPLAVDAARGKGCKW